MNETFPERLVQLQKDPDYFSPEKLEELKIVFDRVCDELGLGEIDNGPHLRDKLAIIILVRAKSYDSEDAMVAAAVIAMQGHTDPR